MKKEILASALVEDDQANLVLIREQLTDSSFVFNVMIGNFEVPCLTQSHAIELYNSVQSAYHKSIGEK